MLKVQVVKTKNKKKHKVKLNRDIEKEHTEKEKPINDLEPPLQSRFINYN